MNQQTKQQKTQIQHCHFSAWTVDVSEEKTNEILWQLVEEDINPSVFSNPSPPPHVKIELQFLYEIKRAENLERNLQKCSHIIDRPVQSPFHTFLATAWVSFDYT